MVDKTCEYYVLKNGICGSKHFGGEGCCSEDYKICSKYENQKYVERGTKNVPEFAKKVGEIIKERGGFSKYAG